eukprot:3164827-Lingulodinium_polyedra.AAC.1
MGRGRPAPRMAPWQLRGPQLTRPPDLPGSRQTAGGGHSAAGRAGPGRAGTAAPSRLANRGGAAGG